MLHPRGSGSGAAFCGDCGFCRFDARGLHAQRQKFSTCDRLFWLKEILPADALTGKQPLFREHARGIFAGKTGGIGVSGAFSGLAYRDDDGGFL